MYRTLLVMLGLLWLSAAAVPAQDTLDIPVDVDDEFELLVTDSLFIEIQLEGNTVTAIDTSGRLWHYDFEFEEWYVGPPDRTIGRTGDGEYGDLADGPSSVEERCTERRKIDLFSNKPVTIGYDEYTDDDIEVFGRVTIKGWAKGDVISHQKRVLVTKTGRVDGDVVAPEVVVQDGGQVLGSIIETDSPLEISRLRVPFSADGLIVAISIGAFILLLAFLMVSLTPRQTNIIHECINRNKVKTYLLGMLFLIMAPIVLTITLVGILALPLLPFAYIAALVAGAVSLGINFGDIFTDRLSLGRRSLLYRALVGVLGLVLMWVVTSLLLGSNSPLMEGLGVFALVVSIVVSSYPLLSGIGALVLTRFGFRAYVGPRPGSGRAAPPPAPPPIPEPPKPSDEEFGDDDETSEDVERKSSQKQATGNKEKDND